MESFEERFGTRNPPARGEEKHDGHGTLIGFGYEFSSHGMMAGSSSYGGDRLDWSDDGSVTLTYSATGGGKRTETVWRVLPGTAEKLRAFVGEKRLAALAGKELPSGAVGADNFTSTSFRLIYDDRCVGGSARETVRIECGMAGMLYRELEAEVRALLRECKETGECLRSETKDAGTQGFLGMLGIVGNDSHEAAAKDFSEAAAAMMNAGRPQTESGGDCWTCPNCGHSGNAGKFCVNCGSRRPG